MNKICGVGLILCLSMGGCQDISPRGQGQVLGTVIGGIFGKQIGDSTASTLAGAIVGQYIGGELADHWKKDNERNIIHTLNRAQDQKVETTWHDHETRYDMVADPISLHKGTPCREFSIEEVSLVRKTVHTTTKGQACLRPYNGSYRWEM